MYDIVPSMLMYVCRPLVSSHLVHTGCLLDSHPPSAAELNIEAPAKCPPHIDAIGTRLLKTKLWAKVAPYKRLWCILSQQIKSITASFILGLQVGTAFTTIELHLSCLSF